MSAGDLSEFSMHDLFVIEVENGGRVLTDGLLHLERDPRATDQFEVLMRAAHSLKGAARIVNLDAAVRVAHAMEDYFVAAQKGDVVPGQKQIDLLLGGVDLLSRISQTPEATAAVWENERKREIDSFVANLTRLLTRQDDEERDAPPVVPEIKEVVEKTEAATPRTDRVLRVTAEHLNRLLGLAGESLVESRQLGPFADSLLRLKRHQAELFRMVGILSESFSGKEKNEELEMRLLTIVDKVSECRKILSDRLGELEVFDQRSTNLSHRLYEEALACRMRPFADGAHGFPRMVRDVARALGKEVKFEIVGETTSVDRDILERIEAPLTHLLRNALDHGLESPEERRRAGKPSEGLLKLDARHHAGMLQVTVSDDGRGIDLEVLRRTIAERKLADSTSIAKMSEAELLEFLFLPGFTIKKTVTEISGRGVGLDVVQDFMKQVRGTVRVVSELGKGARFHLQLPLTLSVVRTLLAQIGGEAYAFPCAYISRTMKLPKTQIEVMEGRQHFQFDDRTIGLVMAHQVLGCSGVESRSEDVPVIVLGTRDRTYGVVVDRFLGERDLVVHPLDLRLGKIKDISAAALMEDGAPGLIIDVEDLIHSIDKLISSGSLNKVPAQQAAAVTKTRKRVLVVDDSLTVREVERKLLASHGYYVETATDGMNGWNAIRTHQFDLVITDVDMPRMDGIELVTLVKKNAATKALPMMIVSYKDREQDRQRGLDAGADYYLTKGSFHDETLLHAVRDLIGEPNL